MAKGLKSNCSGRRGGGGWKGWGGVRFWDRGTLDKCDGFFVLETKLGSFGNGGLGSRLCKFVHVLGSGPGSLTVGHSTLDPHVGEERDQGVARGRGRPPHLRAPAWVRFVDLNRFVSIACRREWVRSVFCPLGSVQPLRSTPLGPILPSNQYHGRDRRPESDGAKKAAGKGLFVCATCDQRSRVRQ
jgi:hypothetical protein